MAGLTLKQKKFADEYIKCGNAEQAARLAGYSARGNTTKILNNPAVKNYIKERSKQLEKSTIASMVEVKEFWTSILRDSEASKRDRLKASELIAKTNGAFLDRVEHSGNIVVIVDDIDGED